MKAVIRLTRLLNLYKGRISGAVLLGAGTIIAGIGLLASSGYLISAAALRPPILDLMVVFVSVRFFGISRAALRYGERMLSHDITFRLLMRMRNGLFRTINNLPASRMLGYRSGALLSSVISDIDELQNYYIRVFTPVIIAVVVSAATFVFLYQFSAKSAWITLVLLIISGGIMPIFIRWLARGLGSRQVMLRGNLSHLWIEQIQGLQDIRLFGLQNTYEEKISDMCDRISRLEHRQSLITGMQDSLFNWIMLGAAVASLVVTAPLVLDGELKGVMLALVVLSVMASFESTQNLGAAFQHLESSEKAENNLFSLTGRDQIADGNISESHNQYGDNDSAPWHQNANGDYSIIFDNVHFSYGADKVLDGIGFKAEAGTKTAIAGPTGCGKSTIFNLILRFYHPDSGFISAGGRKLNEWNPGKIRELISVVDQYTYIFNDTLRNNLMLASHNARDEKLLDALRNAELGQWYQLLPKGLDSMIGEHGKHMSGGERQRLAIARAILKNSPVWMLDEPTAHLDTVTEKSLVKTIREVTKSKTVLWITHRLVQMEYFDRILVMTDEKISERGRHHELMRRKGWYAQMIRMQANLLWEDDLPL